MGFTLEYRAGETIHQADLSIVDLQILELLSQDESLQQSVSILMDSEDFGKPSPAKRCEVIEGIKQLIDMLEANKSTLPYTYGTRMRILPTVPIEDNYGGGLSGIRINNDLYCLSMGLGFCNLQRVEIDEDGMGQPVETIDLRNTPSVQTDNFGEIKILRRRKKVKLKEMLEELLVFLNSRTEDMVQKLIG